MRRMNARNPNIALIGLLFIIILLAFKCWTLSSLNDDLVKEVEKLQAEIKISGMQQDKFEKKNHILQANVHELDEIQKQLKLQVEDKSNKLQEAFITLKNKEKEITGLKNNLLTKEEEEKSLQQQVEDKENKIEELSSDSQHILSLKNDAEDALSEKDTRINSLMMELEQIRKELFRKQQEKLYIRPSISGSNLVADKIEGSPLSQGGVKYVPTYAVRTSSIGNQGIKYHPGQDILPRQASNTKRRKPQFSVANLALEKNDVREPSGPKVSSIVSQLLHPNEISADKNVKEIIVKADASNDVIEKPNYKVQEYNKLDQHETQLEYNNNPPPDDALNHKEKMVLAPPNNINNNLDAAVDEERKAVEDPSDDQDEEGKEIKRDLENNAADNYENYEDEKVDHHPMPKEENNIGEPRGIGAMEVPQKMENVPPKEQPDDVNLVDDVNQRGNERIYEANFENKIRNLGRL